MGLLLPYEVWARINGVWRWCYPLFAADWDDARRQMIVLRDSIHFPRWAYDAPVGCRQWKKPRQPYVPAKGDPARTIAPVFPQVPQPWHAYTAEDCARLFPRRSHAG